MNKEIKESETHNEPSLEKPPKKWWQWVLLYPTFVIFLIGSIPTATKMIQSFRLGVPYTKVDDAETQSRLWQTNFDCVQSAAFSSKTTRSGVEIASTVCESGDVLLKGKRPDWQHPQYHWVAWSDVASIKNDGSEVSLESKPPSAPKISKALWTSNDNQFRIMPVQYGPILMCQVFVNQGILRQRYSTPNGCFDQFINVYTGWVIGTQPAPCFC